MRILAVETVIELNTPLVARRHNVMITKEITVISDNKTVVYASFDKNYAMCDIQPRMNLTLEVLNTYRGRPYDLVKEEMLDLLRRIVRSEMFKEYEDNLNSYEDEETVTESGE